MIIIDTAGLEMRIREGQKGDEIFDPFRKKWISLTPEEWVRQTLLAFLVHKNGYQASLVAIERGMKVGELNRRFDAVVFDRRGKAWMLIECKAPTELLDGSVLSQLLAYQSVLQAEFILVTNGHTTRCWQIIDGSLTELDKIPAFQVV